jgi:hypothetical protein
MIAGLRLGVGMDVARLPALILVAALAAADAFRACIEGTTIGLAPAVLLLAGSPVVALLATPAVAFGPDRPTAAAAAPA